MNRKLISTFISMMLIGVVLLTACTPQATPTVEIAPPTNTPTTPPPTEEPTPEPSPTSEPTPTEKPTPEPITITDGLGNTITIESPAQRVISLAPSNTEILFAIGAGEQVVGRDQFSDFPPEAQNIPDIGGGFGELNLELITSLEPDLILAASLTPPEQIQSLEELGSTVFVLSNPNDFPALYTNLELVGQLTGREAEAEELVADLESRVAAVEQKVAMVEQRPLVFYELDGTDPNAPWTSGPGTFIDQLITIAGGENLGRILDSDWAQISVEELISQDPDIIILGDFTWGGVTPEDVVARAGWQTLSAVKNQNIHTFDDNLVSRPGPRLVAGLEAMAELLHPELFE